ncbi:MAG: nitrilase family protein [Bacteroidales bacterium]|nr:nitrilase family protein [Bacteroidales bacterium]
MQDLKIAYIQADLLWENPLANRIAFEKKIYGLSENVDLIVLPETFTTGFPVDPNQFAETKEGETIAWMSNIASTTNTVVCGSFLMKKEDKFFNSFVWMRPDGTFETYDKRHVFRMGGEHKHIEPGKILLHTELKGWKIRPLICYDMRFPVWSRNRYQNDIFDFDLLIYVANWPAVRAYPWKQLIIARAIENQCFVLGVNRIGSDFQGNNYSGDSCLIDPKGNIVSMATPAVEEVKIAKLVAGDLLQFRENFQVGLDWDNFLLNNSLQL